MDIEQLDLARKLWEATPLTEREREAIELRIFHDETLASAGLIMGITRERVRQIVAKGLRKLQRYHKEFSGEDSYYWTQLLKFGLGQQGETMNIDDIERVIQSIEERSHVLYREDAERADRLAWEVGALRSKLREVGSDLYDKRVAETRKNKRDLSVAYMAGMSDGMEKRA